MTATFEQRLAENEAWIRRCVERVCFNYSDFDDLMQVGRLALWKAHQKYSEAFKVKFLSYAGTFISRDIRRYLARYARTVRLSVAKHCAGQRAEVVSIHAPIGQGKHADKTLSDTIPLPAHEFDAMDMGAALAVFRSLPPKLQTVIEMTYAEDAVDRDIAKAVGCGKNNVALLRTKAIIQMRHAFGLRSTRRVVLRRVRRHSRKSRTLAAAKRAQRMAA